MYYHAWMRLVGGSQAIPNLSRAEVLADVVVPFINKQIRLVDYLAARDAVLNFGAVPYLVILETPDRLDGREASAAALYSAAANGLHLNCTAEILEEAWTSRAEPRAKSLIQRALAPPKKQIFVVMKFGDAELDSAYEGVMKPLAAEFGFESIRIDRSRGSGVISEEILDAIASSEIVLCDLSGARPNCYYETGFADALGRRIILTIREAEAPHFDLAGRRFIKWKTEHELRLKLRAELAGTPS